MRIPFERVEAVADDLLYDEMIYEDVSGEADIYVPEGAV